MREEAIKSALKYLVRKQQEQGSWGYADNDNTNEVSWNEVLEWIDKQPCGDLISREELTKKLEYLCDCLCDYSKRQREFMCDACKLGAVIDAVEELSSVEPERKVGKCKGCKYFEYDSMAKVDGIPLIVAHEICKRWGDGCKTSEDGYCFLYEPQESEGKLDGDPVDIDKAVEHYEGTLEVLKGIDLEVDE